MGDCANVVRENALLRGLEVVCGMSSEVVCNVCASQCRCADRALEVGLIGLVGEVHLAKGGRAILLRGLSRPSILPRGVSPRTCDEPAFRVSPETCDAAFSSSKLKRRVLRSGERTSRNRTPLCFPKLARWSCRATCPSKWQRRTVVVRIVAWVVVRVDPGGLCVPTEKGGSWRMWVGPPHGGRSNDARRRSPA